MDRIVAAHWGPGRLGRVEAGASSPTSYTASWPRRARRQADDHETTEDGGLLRAMSATVKTDEQKHREALSGAEEMEAERETQTAALGRTFNRDADGANALSKLSRYEGAIEGSLYRALHELQRLQQAARRAGGST